MERSIDVKRPLASWWALVLVATLSPAAGSFGQQFPQQGNAGQRQDQQGQGQGQQGSQNSQQNQPAGQQGSQNSQQNQPAGQGPYPNSQQNQFRDQQANWNSVQGNPIIGRLPQDGRWQRAFAWIDEASRNSGMTLAPADAALRAHLNLAQNEGLIVTALEPGSPAASAGIRQNDLLIRLGDDPLRSIPLAKPDDLERALKQLGDQPVALLLLRAGRKQSIKVQPRVKVSLGPVHPEPPTYWIGLSVAPIESALRAQLQIPERVGLIAVEVDKDGPAAKAGVRPFDILTTFDGVGLTDQAGLTKLVQARGEKTVTLGVLRQGKKQEVQITPGRRKTFQVELSFPDELKASQIDIVLPGAVLPGQLVGNEGHGIGGGVTLRELDNDGNLDLIVTNGAGPSKKVEDGDRATAKRLDDLTAQIKELRQAIEALAKAQAKK
jgi:hypothetical protein